MSISRYVKLTGIDDVSPDIDLESFNGASKQRGEFFINNVYNVCFKAMLL